MLPVDEFSGDFVPTGQTGRPLEKTTGKIPSIHDLECGFSSFLGEIQTPNWLCQTHGRDDWGQMIWLKPGNVLGGFMILQLKLEGIHGRIRQRFDLMNWNVALLRSSGFEIS